VVDQTGLGQPPRMDVMTDPRLPTVSGSSGGTADQKLRKAAGEFESMLLANLWKSMKASFATQDEDGDDPAHDTLEDWGIQAMSEAVGKNGGLGIGRLILKHLEPKIAEQTDKWLSERPKVPAIPADLIFKGTSDTSCLSPGYLIASMAGANPPIASPSGMAQLIGEPL